MFIDLKSDVLTLQNQCPKVNPSVSKISLPLHPDLLFCSTGITLPRSDASLSGSFAPQGLFRPAECISIWFFCAAGIISAGRIHPITGRPSLKTSLPGHFVNFQFNEEVLYMKKSISRIIGLIMLIIAIVFIMFALNHPEKSFPWNNTITWLLYGIYFLVTVVLLIAPKMKK